MEINIIFTCQSCTHISRKVITVGDQSLELMFYHVYLHSLLKADHDQPQLYYISDVFRDKIIFYIIEYSLKRLYSHMRLLKIQRKHEFVSVITI